MSQINQIANVDKKSVENKRWATCCQTVVDPREIVKPLPKELPEDKPGRLRLRNIGFSLVQIIVWSQVFGAVGACLGAFITGGTAALGTTFGQYLIFYHDHYLMHLPVSLPVDGTTCAHVLSTCGQILGGLGSTYYIFYASPKENMRIRILNERLSWIFENVEPVEIEVMLRKGKFIGEIESMDASNKWTARVWLEDLISWNREVFDNRTAQLPAYIDPDSQKVIAVKIASACWAIVNDPTGVAKQLTSSAAHEGDGRSHLT